MRNIDIVPALLAPEEHVINRGAVDLIGGQNLANLNIVGRQIMNNNPQRYNKPDGIDQSVPPRLGAKFDQGNGVAGNIPGLAGVIKNGNSYSQAPGFVPSNTVRTPTGIYPQRYQDGTLNNTGVQKPDRMKAYNDAFNARQKDPAYMNYLNNMAKGDANKADTEYSKYLKMKHFKPDGYQEGTTRPDGIRPLNQPSMLDTIKSFVMPEDTQVQQAQPMQQSYVPTVDEARRNAMLQPTSMPVQKYAYGTKNPDGVELGNYDSQGLASLLPGIENPNSARRTLEAQQAMKSTPFVRVNSNQQQPSLFDEAKRSVGNVLNDYAEGNIPILGGIVRNGNSYSKTPVANLSGQKQPVITPKPTQNIGPGNIDMTKVPSQISDAGLPYNAVGNTVNFTNANGTGQGSISERMPVNGGLAARMNDGKGSFSVMKLESPYGPGGKPQEIAPQQVSYQPSQSEDYSGYISDLMTRLDMNRPDGKFDSIGTLIGKKQANRQMQGQIDLLSNLQNQGNQNALNRDKLNADMSVANAKQGLDQAQFNQGVKQQDFNNTLGLADIRLKQKANEANAAKASEEMAINRIKTAPQFHQSKMLQLLTEAISKGAVDDPSTQQIAKIYQMAFGKNPMDDLLATVQQQ